MLRLPSCTAVCVDTKNHALAENAARRMDNFCEFADLFVISDRCLPVDHRLVPTLLGREDYNRFLLTRLLNYVETEYVLIFQWDGFICCPSAWDNAFLNEDYVGAPWASSRGDVLPVGNGGFSLRSRRLLEALACLPPGISYEVPEDIMICRVLRGQLAERHAIRFAAGKMANRFAFEWTYPGVASFGFHGDFNFPRVLTELEMHAVLASAPASFWTERRPLLWARQARAMGEGALAQRLLDHCRDRYPTETANWPGSDVRFGRRALASVSA